MRLEVVVAPHCFGCEEARSIAANVEKRLPWLEVQLIELDGTRPVSPQVFATPTYLLDGEVISLGNPRPEVLIRDLERRHDDCERARESSPV